MFRRRAGSLRSTVFQAVRMAHRYPARPAAVTLAVVASAWSLARLGWGRPFTLLLPAGLLTLAGLTGWWVVRFVARPHTTAALIRRRADLDQRTAGVASRLDVAEHASAAALKHRAPILRPSLTHLSRWERRRLNPTQVGVQIARLGWGWWGEQVWSSCEDATLRVGGPRTGKTLSLACHGLDAPGALITTSTRLDLAEMLHTSRAARGAVHVFNPAGLGGLASTVRWRILTGCEDFATAQRRASDLIPESTGEGERWDIQARRILALFLHAAAVANLSMRDVMRWVYDTTPPGATKSSTPS
jgi:type IV secretion system protein VirD4